MKIRIYVRVASELRAQILDGRLKPRSRMPTISSICRETGYSRHTICKSMVLLEEAGPITRYVGLGYYVTP